MMGECEMCGDQENAMVLLAKCHLTAPLKADLVDGELLLRCYLPDCGREVARFPVAEIEPLKADNERLQTALGRIDDLCDYAEGFYVGTPNDQIKVTIAAVRAAREAAGEGNENG